MFICSVFVCSQFLCCYSCGRLAPAINRNQVQKIILVDNDVYVASNLTRQCLGNKADVGALSLCHLMVRDLDFMHTWGHVSGWDGLVFVIPHWSIWVLVKLRDLGPQPCEICHDCGQKHLPVSWETKHPPVSCRTDSRSRWVDVTGVSNSGDCPANGCRVFRSYHPKNYLMRKRQGTPIAKLTYFRLATSRRKPAQHRLHREQMLRQEESGCCKSRFRSFTQSTIRCLSGSCRGAATTGGMSYNIFNMSTVVTC